MRISYPQLRRMERECEVQIIEWLDEGYLDVRDAKVILYRGDEQQEKTISVYNLPSQYRIANLTERIAHWVLAKSKPDTLIEQRFQEVKDAGKKWLDQHVEKILPGIRNAIGSWLQSSGLEVASVEPKTSKFKGHPYMSACKIVTRPLADQAKAEALAEALRQKFSPKFKLKKYDPQTRVAEYNTR